MEWISKKLSIWTVLTVYAISFMINSVFFVDRGKVAASWSDNLTKIVAVIVDKDLYPSIQSNIERYTTSYIQARQADTKAIVLPINTKNIWAPDITKILENIYFDGIQDVPSRLAGIVLIGNIPLPVVQDNGFIYPSIYPYVDFEQQQFVYDTNKWFFVPNDNPNGQAEVWHGIINFTGTAQYVKYFQKLKNYTADPEAFVDPQIWYDDFIGTKKYFIQENTEYYVNKQIFAEDIGYHRLNNLLLNTLKGEYNSNATTLGDTLQNDLADTENQELKAYADMIKEKQDIAGANLSQMSWDKTPTLVIGKSIDQLTKTYDGLISTKLLTKIQDNVQSAARRYKQDLSGNWMDSISSHYEKIVHRDNWIFGSQPILIQLNNALESGLNQEIASKKYAMKYPMPLTFENVDYYNLIYTRYSYYQNFYFGVTGNTITDANNLSIYRGTYQNLDTLTGATISTPQKSVWWSYHVFSQQIEANRGYNLLNTEAELALRSGSKQYLLHEKTCTGWFGFIPGTDMCLGIVWWNTSYGEDHDFTDVNWNNVAEEAKESPADFAIRLRWGASPINLDTEELQNRNTYLLSAYNFRHAIAPIYDIAWWQKTTITTSGKNTNSYLAIQTYGSLIKTKDQAGAIYYPRAIATVSGTHDKATLINNIPFVLKETVPAINVDFFTIFQANNERTNTIWSPITLKRVSWANGSWFSDYKVYTYKLIDTSKKNISPTPAEISGMNITTADRPIDSMRNITFEGIGGDIVQFAYPNLYEVPVYKTEGNMLALKNETEILTAIKAYLQDKVTEYNNALTTQQNKKDQFYQTHTAAFNFLAQADPAATPNRSYTLLPQDFLIQQMVNNLDSLAATYWTTYIYGDKIPTTIDEKLLLIAKLLYYQNSSRSERKLTSTIGDDIQDIQDKTNINKKISDTTNIYLQSKHDEGAFVSPTYNKTGYEVAYINSDGFDLIDNNETPAFVKQLQAIKTQKGEEATIANKILEQVEKGEMENAIDTECGVDPTGTALLFDIKTGKSPWIAAMKCRAKKTFEQPFKISVNFKNAQWPTVAGFLQEAGENFTNWTSERKNYWADVQQKDEANNATILENSTPAIQLKLKEYQNVTDIKPSASSRFVDSTEPKELTISSFRSLEKTQVRLSATGDVCLWIQKDNKTLASNLCKEPYSFSLWEENKTYNLADIQKQNKVGTMVITAKFCLGASPTKCISKSKSMTILPAPVDKITIKTPTQIMMMGASLPISITAQDAFGNSIWQGIENYTIVPQTGTLNWEKTMDFNNFSKANFVYQAPEKVTENTPITIKVSGKNQNGKLITGEQKLIIAKGIANVSYANQIVFSTNIPQARTIGYHLPATASDLVKTGTDNIAQVQTAAIPKLSIELQDRNGNKLDSVANIVSRYGLLMPWKLQQNMLDISGHKLPQTIFQAQGDIIITDGMADIWLYPSLQAGTEEIIINIPWLDPIRIVINVYPGKASKVSIQLDDNSLFLWENSSTSSGTIQVLDNRNNIVKESVSLKIWALGPWLINNQTLFETTWNGSPIAFTLQAKQPGGVGHLFAYLRDIPLNEQEPAEQSFFIQNNVLPETWLNVMYLNLFWTDRGNQRGYFSDNNQKVNQLTETSDKLLTTTTSLIDPTKIKQIKVLIAPDGQIQTLGEEINTLHIISGQVIVEIPTIGTVNYWLSTLFDIVSLTKDELTSRSKNQNTILYIPEQTDSVISGNIISNKKLLINGKSVIDFNIGTMDTSSTIEANGESINGLTTYDILRNSSKIWTLAIYKKTAVITTNDIKVDDSIKYAKEATFTQGSTNTAMGIGIYDTQSSFSKNGYQSIEDSIDPLAGIWFTSKFKNISYFAAGKNVGQATLPYGSAFLINFGDPLVQRISENITVSKTPYDGNAGQEVFSNPNKTIFKTLPTDFDNDGLQDLLIAYTDGSVQLLKNYGGKEPFQNLQDLMIIWDTIKEIHVGDVNKDTYPDILIWTNADKVLVYQNRKGIIDVDWTSVCLNTNTSEDEMTSTPNNISAVHQLLFEDMDRDGAMDIITNDIRGDIKIFYGGRDSRGNGYYVSTQTGTCDEGRFTRQKNNYQLVKSLGLKINADRYITDDSLVHRKNMPQPDESTDDTESPEDDTTIDDPTGMSKNDALAAAKNFVNDTATYTVMWAKELSYVDNPTKKVPVYETLSTDEIKYLPVSKLSGENISVYKKYEDINGGILKDGDQVKLTITILSLANNQKITYLDQLKWPREIRKDTDNKIVSRTLTGSHTNGIQTDRNVWSEYQVMVDNILLQTNETLTMSYIILYQEPALTKIKIQDKDLSDVDIHKTSDWYPDIIIQTNDPCIKSQRISWNSKSHNKWYKEYVDVIKDLDTKADDYASWARTTQEDQLDSAFQQVDATTAQSIATLPGVSDILESRNIQDLFTNGWLNLNLDMNFIDEITAGISKKLDEGLRGLCEWFKLGNEWCQGIPVPFNQAFLAPGEYHIFGCVPKPFKIINQTLGKGLPILSFPTNSTIPIWPPTTDGAGGLFGWTTSQFRLYIAPTMTLGLGIALCVGPYGVGAKLPKPFRDIAGNCIIFAIPGAMLPCNGDNSANDTATSKGWDEVNPDLVTDNGSCQTPPIIGNKIVFASTNNSLDTSPKGTSSPLQAVETQGNISNPLVPQGNFGWLIQIDQEPTITTSAEAENAQNIGNADITLTPGEKINLKVVGGKVKWLIKCIIQSWMTRQLKFIINNITKMTIQVNLPDMSQMVQGFDKLGNLGEIYKQINAEDTAAGSITPAVKVTTGNILTWLKAQFSRQQRSSISKKIGQNPFEAIATMFKDVPLININTRDINVKIPSMTSEDIAKYGSYLQSWIAKNAQIVEDWTSLLNQILALCGTTSKADAQKMKDDLTKQLASIETIQDANIKNLLKSEIKDMENILKLPQDTTRQELWSDVKNLWINITNTAKKVATLPMWKWVQVYLSAEKGKATALWETFEKQALLSVADKQVQTIGKCAGIAWSIDGFISFKDDTEKLITSVQENIKVLEQYKRFPGQLYERIHITDRYLWEIGSITSEFVGGLTTWLDTNANRFSQYVDAITLIIWAIKTRQAIIDFAVNRSERCSKCSNDNYGSFSCSLSFLCPQLPIFKIPSFKIPDITLDLSHIEVGLDILLPKFNFVPMKIPLPELPSLPEPPSYEVNIDLLGTLDLGSFDFGIQMPSIPVLPGPPQLPELPSFIPNIDLELPILPPAPKIPKILPEISVVLKVADFIGKIFCIVKWGIGLVGEKWVKAKIEQLTQRTRNVPVFDFFDLTSKFKDPPLEWFDYTIDAYVRLKYNFEWVYALIDSIVQSANQIVTSTIEAPMQEAVKKTTNLLNSGTNINIPDWTLNINSMLPMDATGLEYADAYQQLQAGLNEFSQQASQNKKILSQIETIKWTINADSKVTAASKEIKQAKAIADSMVNQKQQEIKNIQDQVKDYDQFITDIQKNQIQLVSQNENMQTTISTPLININETTKQLLANQEAPEKTYIALNKSLVQWYQKAMASSSAADLNMTDDTYQKSQKYLNELADSITKVETITNTQEPAKTEKILLASACNGGTCPADTMEENGYSQDMSSYVQGVLIQTGQWATGKTMVNVVNNLSLANEIGKKYIDIDINNDGENDLIMRDSNTVYAKYAQQNNEYLTAGGSHLSTTYTRYFAYQNGNKRRLDSMEDAANTTENGYANFDNIKVKIFDTNSEVKNFKTQGQSFDSLQLTRKNSISLGENISGYVIKLSYKVDNFFEKIRTFNFFGNETTPTTYIVLLPTGTPYATGLLSVESINKKPIKALLTGEVWAVKYFDVDQDNVSISINDVPSKWMYAEIASLRQDQSQLSNAQRKSLSLFVQWSPRSNQIVAGKQILADTEWPIGDIILQRVLTNEVIGTGNTQQWWINTNYTLRGNRQDKVAVTHMTIEHKWITIYSKTWTSITGSIEIPNLFFTGATQDEYVFKAIDANNNISKEVVNFTIKIPDISITEVKKIDEQNAQIIALLENDLDEGLVTFQRERNGLIKAITWTNANNLWWYPLSPWQKIITGWIMRLGNTLGLYTPDGEEIGTLNPDNGEIIVWDDRKNKIQIKLDFLLHIPTIKIIRKYDQQELFQIALPMQKMESIVMKQGKPTYQTINLTQSQFGEFEGGYCIQNADKECMIYVNALGKIYIPNVYNNTLWGHYSFDSKNKTILYTITDEKDKAIAIISLQMKPLFE